MRTLVLWRALLLASGVAMLSTTTPAVAADDWPPAVQRLAALAPTELFDLVNGTIEAATVDGVPVWRWHPSAGQPAELNLRTTHPLFARLRYYDRLRLEFRIAAGSINTFELNVLGHVSGPRQYKIHNFLLAPLTIAPQVWHLRDLDLARPNWFPWDSADGTGGNAFCRFSAIGLTPDTVIELRSLELSRPPLLFKPDFELPVTWPVRRADPDGHVLYTWQHAVANTGGAPATLSVAVAAAGPRFQVGVFAAAEAPATLPLADWPQIAQAEIKHAARTTFTVVARLPAAAAAALPELYAEPVRLRFASSLALDATVLWEGRVTRPLAATVRRQGLLAPAQLQAIRAGLAANDEKLKTAIAFAPTIKAADEFLTKELLRLPSYHTRAANNWVPDWRPGARMPEAVNTKTGEKEFDTTTAAATWKEYLGNSGNACRHLAHAYLFTGDEKYAQKSIELFRLYARQYSALPWSPSFEPPWSAGPTTLGASRISTSSTYGSNWMGKGHCQLLSAIADSPSWDEATRTAVYRDFVLPYATELMKFPGGISNMTDITNHNVLLLGLAWQDANLVRWALYSDPGLLQRLQDIDEDGFSSEGRPLNYHGAAMSEYLPALEYLAHAGLDVDFPRERLLAAVRMPYQRATLWGQVPSTGDCARGQGVGRSWQADHLVALFPKVTWLYDLGGSATIAKKLLILQTGREPEADGWRRLLDSRPRLFRTAGLAILRQGDTPETQVMATLDYGRNPMHAHLDRQQLTVAAFGRIYTHGPGTLYNVGSGGMTRTNNPKLDSFCGGGSLGQNVVLIDQQNQAPAVGELLAWEPGPERQLARSRIAGLRPGVVHTRQVVLERGVIVVADWLTADAEHEYDFVYHNLGRLAAGPGWQTAPVAEPLGRTANYENLQNVQRLQGAGGLRLTWDLSAQVKAPAATEAVPASPAFLALWQLPTPGGTCYLAETGMNNPNTMTIPDAAPTLITRSVRGKTATFWTVLEPYRAAPAVTGVEAAPGGRGVVVTLHDGPPLTVTGD